MKSKEYTSYDLYKHILDNINQEFQFQKNQEYETLIEPDEGHSILQYRIYNTHRVWMFENLQNEENVIAINEDIVKENVKTKPLDWIIRRTNSILDFLYDYNDIYSNLFNNSYKSLKRDYEYLKNKYETYDKK